MKGRRIALQASLGRSVRQDILAQSLEHSRAHRAKAIHVLSIGPSATLDAMRRRQRNVERLAGLVCQPEVPPGRQTLLALVGPVTGKLQ